MLSPVLGHKARKRGIMRPSFLCEVVRRVKLVKKEQPYEDFLWTRYLRTYGSVSLVESLCAKILMLCFFSDMLQTVCQVHPPVSKWEHRRISTRIQQVAVFRVSFVGAQYNCKGLFASIMLQYAKRVIVCAQAPRTIITAHNQCYFTKQWPSLAGVVQVFPPKSNLNRLLHHAAEMHANLWTMDSRFWKTLDRSHRTNSPEGRRAVPDSLATLMGPKPANSGILKRDDALPTTADP